MKFRIRRIDSRDYGNALLAEIHDYMHVVEQQVLRKRYRLFGPLIPVWIEVGSAISQLGAEDELNKLLQGPRKRAEPVITREIEV